MPIISLSFVGNVNIFQDESKLASTFGIDSAERGIYDRSKEGAICLGRDINCKIGPLYRSRYGEYKKQVNIEILCP